MNLRVLLLGLLGFASVALVGCDSESCSDELRGYSIAIDRPLGVAVSEIDSLRIETCVSGTCQTESPVAGRLGEPMDADNELLSGTIEEGAEGTYLKGSVQLNEADGETQISVRVTTASGQLVSEASGAVKWLPAEDQACHTTPDRMRL